MIEGVLPVKQRASAALAARAVLTVSIVLAAAGFTMAIWTDSVTSENNVYATGSLDLKLRELGSTAWVQGPVHATWHAENMYPGQELNDGAVYFKNAGTVEGLTFDIAVANVCTVPGMDAYVQITQMEYENGIGHNLLSPTDPYRVQDLNGNGWIDLDDLEHGPCLGLPAPETVGALTMDYRFHEDAGNEFQAASVTAEFTFTLHQ